jgi:hypothetical protein
MNAMIRAALAAFLLLVAIGCRSENRGPEAAALPSPGLAEPVEPAGGTTSPAVEREGRGASAPDEDPKRPRGNTPPGIDRDGHGPAAGAIIDPTGAATRTKPY